jgi:hypothetical protein
MKVSEVKFEDLSHISYRMLLREQLPIETNTRGARILVIEFKGKHGIGSEGNNDSLFMATTIRAAMNVWYVDGLVLDFSDLVYEWGNSIGDVLLAGKSVLGRKFPTALVVSESSRPGFESAHPFYAAESQGGGQTKWLFDDLDSAAVYIKEEFELSRTEKSKSQKKSFWKR